MKVSRKIIFLIVLCIEIIGLLVASSFVILSKADYPNFNVQAQADALTVEIDRDQYYFKDDTMRTVGYIYWAELEGGNLILYGNTSDMFVIAFWDARGNLTEDTDYIKYNDRIVITIRTTELFYEIQSNYYPDYFLDTNFIVIFDTFWAQFSYITPEGEERYAPVTYHNKQLLPEGAGLVSYAPTDGTIIVKEGNSFGIVWEYTERAMDPFHDPLTYEITYNFDPIYLQFTEQMYENQLQQQEIEQLENLLDLLKTYFKLIAYFAVVISIIAALIGYLRAKRKFKSRLNEAKSMPKKMLRDIEGEQDPRKRVSALFNVAFIILLITPMLYTNQQQLDNITYISNDRVITIDDYRQLGDSSRNIRYEVSVDLGKDGFLAIRLLNFLSTSSRVTMTGTLLSPSSLFSNFDKTTAPSTTV